MPPKKFEKPPGLTDIRGKYTKKSPPIDTSLSYTNLHLKPRLKQTAFDSSPHIHSQITDSSNKSSRFHSLTVSTPYLANHNWPNRQNSLNDVNNQSHILSKQYGEVEPPLHSLVDPSGLTAVSISQDGRLILPQIPDQSLQINSYFSDEGSYPPHLPTKPSLKSFNGQPIIFKAPVYQAKPTDRINTNRLIFESGAHLCDYDTDNNEILDIVHQNKDPQLEQYLKEISNQLLLSAKQREQRPSCLPLSVSSILVQNDPEDPLGMRHRLPAQFKSFERYLEGKFGMDEQTASSNLEEIDASSSKEDNNSKKKSIFSQLNSHIRATSPSKQKTNSKSAKNKARMECPLPKVPIISPSFDRPSISIVNPSNLAVLAADSFNHTRDSFSSLSSNSTNPYPQIIGEEYASSPSETSETYSYISDCPAINESSIFRGTLSQSNSHMDQLDELSNHYPSGHTVNSNTPGLQSTMLIRPGPNRPRSNRYSTTTPPASRTPEIDHQKQRRTSNHSRTQKSKFSEEEGCYNSAESSDSSEYSQSFASSLNRIARPRIQYTPDLQPTAATNNNSQSQEQEPTYQNLIPNSWDFSFPMVAFHQLPELVWVDNEFWYSKFKDYLEADYNSNVELPAQWTTGRSSQGRLYLAHDETRLTTWFHPVLGPRVPFGWERVDTLREGVYYHNVFVRHSQRHHPNLWIVMKIKAGNIEEENCFKVLRALQHKSNPSREIGENSRQYYSAMPGIHEQKFTLNVRKLSLPTLTKVKDDLDELFFRELRSIIVRYETYRSAIVKELSRRRFLLRESNHHAVDSSAERSHSSPRHNPPQIAYNATSSEAQLHRVHELVVPPFRYSNLLKDVDSSDWSSDDEDSV